MAARCSVLPGPGASAGCRLERRERAARGPRVRNHRNAVAVRLLTPHDPRKPRHQHPGRKAGARLPCEPEQVKTLKGHEALWAPDDWRLTPPYPQSQTPRAWRRSESAARERRAPMLYQIMASKLVGPFGTGNPCNPLLAYGIRPAPPSPAGNKPCPPCRSGPPKPGPSAPGCPRPSVGSPMRSHHRTLRVQHLERCHPKSPCHIKCLEVSASGRRP